MLNEMLPLLSQATLETLYMVFLSSALATLFGLPLGVILFLTRPKQMLSNTLAHQCLGWTVNITRSFPFIILLVAIIPFTRLIVGTSIGMNAAIVPLTIGAIPFIARIIENALCEVPAGLIEAAQAMGATPIQITYKVLLPEALANIVNGLTLTIITLVGYSAMAGVVGGGGLGDLAIRYGYQRFDWKIMVATVIVLIIVVQCIQMIGDHIARHYRKS